MYVWHFLMATFTPVIQIFFLYLSTTHAIHDIVYTVVWMNRTLSYSIVASSSTNLTLSMVVFILSVKYQMFFFSVKNSFGQELHQRQSGWVNILVLLTHLHDLVAFLMLEINGRQMSIVYASPRCYFTLLISSHRIHSRVVPISTTLV